MAKDELVYCYRRVNLKRVVDSFGGPTRVAELLGYKNASFIVHMIGPNPTRTVSDKNARSFELPLGLEVGSLDIETDIKDDLMVILRGQRERQDELFRLRDDLSRQGDLINDDTQKLREALHLAVLKIKNSVTYKFLRIAAETLNIDPGIEGYDLIDAIQKLESERPPKHYTLDAEPGAYKTTGSDMANTLEGKRPAFAWVADIAKANKAKQPSILEDLQLIEIRLPEFADDIKAQIRAKAAEIRQILAPPTPRPAELAGSTGVSVTATGTLTTSPALASFTNEEITRMMADPRTQVLLAELKQKK
jgi:hypothetical protein